MTQRKLRKQILLCHQDYSNGVSSHQWNEQWQKLSGTFVSLRATLIYLFLLFFFQMNYFDNREKERNCCKHCGHSGQRKCQRFFFLLFTDLKKKNSSFFFCELIILWFNRFNRELVRKDFFVFFRFFFVFLNKWADLKETLYALYFQRYIYFVRHFFNII